MNTQHIHVTAAHPSYCKRHNREFYPRTCGHGTGCIGCDLEAAVTAARAKLPVEVNGRLEKAIDLVRAGNVYVASGRAAVKSQSSERVYVIDAAGCRCEDAHYRAPKFAGRRACKHMIAVWLRLKMEQQVMQPPAAPAVAADSQATDATDFSTNGSGVKPLEERWCAICKKTTMRKRDGRCIHCCQTDEQARRGPRVQDWSWAR